MKKAIEITKTPSSEDDEAVTGIYYIKKIGATGFEPATSRPPAVRSSQTEPYPENSIDIITPVPGFVKHEFAKPGKFFLPAFLDFFPQLFSARKKVF